MNARASQQPSKPVATLADSTAAPAAPGDAATFVADPLLGIASDRDEAGIPVHRGWAPVGSHHRWMEPFVMVLLSVGPAHGYAIVGELADLGITNGAVDIGQVYRTLRDLEGIDQVRSTWSTSGPGPARREYELTTAGYAALDEWAAVIKERARLIGEFDARYLESLSTRRTR
jgi:DNA-binding PadR family transcriptional regulator